MKLWNEIRGEILRLGAQGEERYEAAPALFVEAVNRAAVIVAAAFDEPTPDPLTPQSPDDTGIALSREAAVALPLLAAFYVFEDEDERKAVRWREDAYDLMGRFTRQRQGKAQVRGQN